MTLPEACALAVRVTRELSAARDEAASYRVIAQEAIHLLHDQHLELTRTRERYHQLLEERRTSRPAA